MKDQELDSLRRRAYSRTGTADDLRRLAAREGVTRPAEAGEVSEPARSPRSWRQIVVAGAAGAILGALIATVITFAVFADGGEQPDEATALVVFDREARSVDDPSNLVTPIEDLFRGAEGTFVAPDDQLELRWVGSPQDLEVYAVRWRHDESVSVCLIVESADGAATARCASEDDFVQGGLRMTAFGVNLRWGPTGTEVWVNSFR